MTTEYNKQLAKLVCDKWGEELIDIDFLTQHGVCKTMVEYLDRSKLINLEVYFEWIKENKPEKFTYDLIPVLENYLNDYFNANYFTDVFEYDDAIVHLKQRIRDKGYRSDRQFLLAVGLPEYLIGNIGKITGDWQSEQVMRLCTLLDIEYYEFISVLLSNNLRRIYKKVRDKI